MSEALEMVPELIQERAEFNALVEALAREPRIAVDTESNSLHAYRERVCLMQFSTPQRDYVVDVLALEDVSKLGPVFESQRVEKVFHAAEYDIFVLKRDCGFRFASLFDTMISAQLLGYPAVGLSALVERHFEVRLPKDEQRSDWSERPLSDSQLTYAAADVAHLIPLAERLERELKKTKRSEWAEEEFEALCRREWPERSFDRLGYLRIRPWRCRPPPRHPVG